MSQTNFISRQTWIRSFFVSTLAFLTITSIAFGATTISTNITTDGFLTVNGNATLGTNNTNTLTVNATPTFVSAATFNNSATFTDTVTIGNNTHTVTIDASNWDVDSLGVGTLKSLTINDNTILGSDNTDTLTINATPTFASATTFNNDVTFTDTVIIGNSSNPVTINADVWGINNLGYANLNGLITTGSISLTDPQWSISDAGAASFVTFTNSSTATFNGDVNLGSNSGGDDIVITDDQWDIDTSGIATFSGLNTNGSSDLFGNLLAGDTTGGGILLEVDATNDEISLEGGNISIGGIGGDNIEIGLDGGSVDIDTNSGVITIGSGGLTFNGNQTINNVIHATAALDFPSIAIDTCQELSITATGAAANDLVSVGAPSSINNGLNWNAYVQSADTVYVRVCNVTAGAIDPASATWAVSVTEIN